MDVREKLIEILEEPCGGLYPACELADYLISDGVTVQEWISVDDRLPEEFVSVLGHMTDAGYLPSIRECYRVGNRFFFPVLKDIHPIDFWADMPEPPKGE